MGATLPTDTIDIVELKQLARSKLPTSGALRDLILSEPDCLPEAELLIKVRMYSKMLYRELRP